MNKSLYFKLYSNNYIVDGFSRSMICDLQTSKHYYIPNALSSIIKTFSGYSLNTVYDNFQKDEEEILDEYFNYLLKNDLIYLSTKENIDSIKDLPIDYQCYSDINTVIVEINSKNNLYRKVFEELTLLNTSNIQLRFLDDFSIEEISAVVSCLKNSTVNEIQVLANYNQEFINKDYCVNIISNEVRISKFIVYNAPNEKEVNLGEFNILLFLEDSFNDSSEIYLDYFTLNMKHFMEAKNNNSYHNSKIFIDGDGYVYNTPQYADLEFKLYNIIEEPLKEIVKNFRCYNLSKNNITICQDCEYRYMCFDPRPFKKESYGYSLIGKCNYNPYISKWLSEDGYVEVEETFKVVL